MSGLVVCALVGAASPAFAQDANGSVDIGAEPLPPPAAPSAASTPSATVPEHAPAAASAATAAPETSAPEGPARHDLVRINVGFRVGYVPSSGFDAFATSDVLNQFSIDAAVPFYRRGKLVLAAGVGWDVGGRSDAFRGFESSLTVHRLSVPVEARWQLAPWLYGFGKVAPGTAAMHASVRDTSVGEVSTTAWAFSADASVGTAILLGPRTHLEKRRVPRFWVMPEIGYAFTTNASLALNPNRPSNQVLGSDEDTNLRSLSLSGLFWRMSVALTF